MPSRRDVNRVGAVERVDPEDERRRGAVAIHRVRCGGRAHVEVGQLEAPGEFIASHRLDGAGARRDVDRLQRQHSAVDQKTRAEAPGIDTDLAADDLTGACFVNTLSLTEGAVAMELDVVDTCSGARASRIDNSRSPRCGWAVYSQSPNLRVVVEGDDVDQRRGIAHPGHLPPSLPP